MVPDRDGPSTRSGGPGMAGCGLTRFFGSLAIHLCLVFIRTIVRVGVWLSTSG